MGSNTYKLGRDHKTVVTIALAFAMFAAGCSSSGDSASNDVDQAAPTVSDSVQTTDSQTADPQPTVTESPNLPAIYDDYVSENYTDDAKWLCKPGIENNVCERSLDTTVVSIDGSTEVIEVEPAADPAFDCFYVYPTASQDQSYNSDFTPQEADEIFTAYSQAAPYGTTCRVFAPIYRSRTVPALVGAFDPPEGTEGNEVAYGDVLDAFRHYMANDNEGRGVVLIGHSQGTGMLYQLISEEIEVDEGLLSHVISAHLLGGSIAVPNGEIVGGVFQNIPLCQSADEFGCVVTYATYRETQPPTPGAIFGTADDGLSAGCVNPADPSQPTASLEVESSFLLDGKGALGANIEPFEDPTLAAELATPWVTYKDLVSAKCVNDGEFSYLSLALTGTAPGGRIDDVGGDLTPSWGMHLIDMNVAIGNLVDLAASQGEAYLQQ